MHVGTNPQSSRGKKPRPSFCKVLFRDFSTHLLIPPAFVKSFDEFPEKAILSIPDKGNWPVDVKTVTGHLSFENGWSSFVQDTSLEHGDFLIFKYIKNSIFGVTIYEKSGWEKDISAVTKKICDPSSVKGNQVEEEGFADKNGVNDQVAAKRINVSDGTNDDETAASNSSKLNCKTQSSSISERFMGCKVIQKPSHSKAIEARGKKVRAAVAESKFNSKYPSFKVTMRWSYIKCNRLNLPISFSSNLEGVTNVTLKVSNKSWQVKLCLYPYRADKFSRGWPAFVKENNVKIGDVCAFKLIKKNGADATFKVSISRSSQC